MPYTTNVGSIFSVEQNAKYTSQNKLALRLIESEINNNMKFTDNILADQVSYLAILFDLLIEQEDHVLHEDLDLDVSVDETEVGVKVAGEKSQRSTVSDDMSDGYSEFIFSGSRIRRILFVTVKRF